MKAELQKLLQDKFLEYMHDSVFLLDTEYNILDCNNAASELYGYKKQEFLKLNLRDIRAPSVRYIVPAQMQQALEENGTMWETIHLRKDNTTFFAEVSSTPLLENDTHYFYHVVRDISDRKQAEFDLRQSEERYHQIIDLSPDTIFIFRDAKIIFANQSALKMFGANKTDQLVGHSIWMLYPPERHGIVRSRMKSMEQTRDAVPIIEHTVIRLDGKLITIEATARLIIYDKQDAFYVIMRDITDRKKTNSHLEMQYAVSRELIESATSIDAAISALKTICKNLNFDLGKILTFDKDENVLRCIAAWNNDYDNDIEEKIDYQMTRKPGEGLSGRVLETGEPCWFEDITKYIDDTYPKDFVYKLGVATPISNGHEIIGVMEFMDRKPIERDEMVLNALFGIGNQIGSFLKRKNYERELDYAAKHDVMTGLANRSLFEDTLRIEIQHAKNRGKKLAILFLDINSFSNINGSIGHHAGDELLKQVASRLVKLIGVGNNIARLGDDQFGFVLNDINSAEEVTDFVHKVNSAIVEPFVVENQKLNLTVSIGISFYPEDSEDIQSLMKSASIALTSAKEAGIGTFQFCTVDMTSRAKKRISMENDLREAINKDELILYYQPIIHHPSMRIEGFESLLRWNRNGSIVSPADFIPLAEKTQLIVPIGEWIIHAACAQAKIWQALTPEPTFVSVNVSAVQFTHSSVLQILADTLHKTGLAAGCLKVELTEAAVMDDVQKSIKTLNKIKEMGVKISIDDFGTGYSSLNYLKQLPIDYLKIDQSFVRDVTTNQNDVAIIKTIIDLASNLGYKVIAEGVETEEQLQLITKLGCHEIQGYFFSKPLPVADATEYLRKITI